MCGYSARARARVCVCVCVCVCVDGWVVCIVRAILGGWVASSVWVRRCERACVAESLTAKQGSSERPML